MEAEWQPARIVPFHQGKNVRLLPEEIVAAMLKKVIRVRPIPISQLNPRDVEEQREDGCDGDRFYEIHPDDCIGGSIICEHEILTD